MEGIELSRLSGRARIAI